MNEKVDGIFPRGMKNKIELQSIYFMIVMQANVKKKFSKNNNHWRILVIFKICCYILIQYIASGLNSRLFFSQYSQTILVKTNFLLPILLFLKILYICTLVSSDCCNKILNDLNHRHLFFIAWRLRVQDQGTGRVSSWLAVSLHNREGRERQRESPALLIRAPTPS